MATISTAGAVSALPSSSSSFMDMRPGGSRPTLSRLDTEEQILDYYGSEEASGVPYFNSLQSRVELPSGVEYPTSSPQSSTRRTRVPSLGGADNRRLHIVEFLDASDATLPTDYLPSRSTNQAVGQDVTNPDMPTFNSTSCVAASTATEESSLLARRTKNGSQYPQHPRLALVAPPDAALASYTDLTPPDMLVIGGSPRSAPSRPEAYDFFDGSALGTERSLGGSDNGRELKDHRRTKSHSVDQPPRMINVTGPVTVPAGVFKRRAGQLSPRAGMVFPHGDYTSYRTEPAYSPARETLHEEPEAAIKESSTTSPTTAFTQASPSYSTAPSSSSPPDDHSSSMHLKYLPPPRTLGRHNTDESRIVTPAIGEAKDPMTRVAAPVVIDLANAMRPLATSGSTELAAAKAAVSPPMRVAPVRSPSISGVTPPPRPPRLHSPSSNGLRKLAIGSSSRQINKGTDSLPASPASELLVDLKQEPSRASGAGGSNSPLSQSQDGLSLPSLSPSVHSNRQLRATESLEEIPIMLPGHHRREPAHATRASPPQSDSTFEFDPDKTVTIVSPPSPDLLPSAPHMSHTPHSQAHPNLQLAPQRPELSASRWSSYDSHRKSTSSKSSDGRSGLEDLMEAVGEAIENIGLMRAEEIQPPTTVDSPRAGTSPGEGGPGGSLSSSPASSQGMYFTPASTVPTTAELRLQPRDGSPGTRSRPLSGQSERAKTPPPQSSPLVMVDLSSPLKGNDVSSAGAVATANGLPMPGWNSISPIASPHSSPQLTQAPSSFPPPTPAVRRYSGEGTRPNGGLASRPRSIRSIKRFSILHQRTPSFNNLNHNLQVQHPKWSTMLPEKKQRRRLGGLGAGMPDAMSCKDVVTKKTALERASGYERKMRELLRPDVFPGENAEDQLDGGSGLGEWIDFVKGGQQAQRRQVRQRPDKPAIRTRQHSFSASSNTSTGNPMDSRSVTPTTPNSALPPMPSFQPQSGMRNASHGSEASEMTFPRRPDAYVATDLRSGARAGRESPPDGKGPPPNIPYPGLVVAQQQHQQQQQAAGLGIKASNSIRGAGASAGPMPPSRSGTLASPIKGGGFFASIGRKASMRSKERPALGDLAKKGIGAGMGMLTSRPSQVNIPSSQPKMVVAKPSLIGGPRPPRSAAAAGSPRSSTLDSVASNQVILASGSTESVVVIERRSTESSNGGAERSPGGTSVAASSSWSGDGPRTSMSATAESGYSTQVERDRYDTDAGMESDVGHLPIFSTYQNHNNTNSAQKLISRSSLTYRTLTSPNLSTITAFNANLDKVQDVLPHVDKDILALYLKRSNGDDMRAIGAYLDDERKGIVMGQ